MRSTSGPHTRPNCPRERSQAAASPSTQNNLTVPFVFTWLIAAGDFQHVIAGAVEMSYVVLSGEERPWPLASEYLLPVLAGNIVGGTLVFTLTAWGQVRQEVKGGQD